MMRGLARNIIRKARVSALRIAYQHIQIQGSKFRCPICQFEGPFMTSVFGERRQHAICPRCLSVERHRLQRLVCDKVFDGLWDPDEKMLLQFAPDPMTGYLRSKFGSVICADIIPGKNRVVLDMRDIDMEDASVDAVYASHVLEHIREDIKAVQEIHRVLKPGGIAVLPVPIVSDSTIEYPEAVATEEYHWRAPGFDYFDRYRAVFGSIRIFSSRDFDEIYQTYDYGDRTAINRKRYPYRRPMVGRKHADFVPVCFKN
jgi:SAM-dependent methyltransferase